MSCMNKIDPYNNAPPSRGKCGKPPQQNQMPNQMGKIQQQQQMDPWVENQMLKADLQVALSYIRHLGGTWPPPGQ